MILAPHIIVGASFASNFPNPLIGLGLAFLSHFLLDKIPHWEYSIEPLKFIKAKGVKYCEPVLRRIFLDLFAGGLFVLIAIALSRNDIPFYICVLGAFLGILPDGMSGLYFVKPRNKILKVFFDLHQKIHFQKEKGKPPLRVGLAWQIAASLLGMYFLIF